LKLQSRQIAGTLGIAIASALTALASLLQTCVMQGQLDQTKTMVTASTEANAIARDALESSERPWLGIDRVETGSLQADQPFHAKIFLANAGRTPAMEAQTLFKIGTAPIDAPLAPRAAADCDNCSRSILLPGGTLMQPITLPATKLGAQAVERIKKSGTDAIWISGRIEYSDRNGKRHIVIVCERYHLFESGFSGFSPCPAGNSAD
jgi:hypothetical protein